MKFEIFKTTSENKYYFSLIADNGQILLSSIGFDYKDQCKQAIIHITSALSSENIVPVIRNNGFALTIKNVNDSKVAFTQTYKSSESLSRLKTLLLRKLPTVVYADIYENLATEVRPEYPVEVLRDTIFSNQEEYVFSNIYLDTNDTDLAKEIYRNFNKFLDALGFDVEDESEAILGSWIKRVIYKIKKPFQSEDVKEIIKKGEHALELITIKKTQSEIDRNQVEAAANLIQSLEKVDSAAFKIGSLILIKVTDDTGNTKVVSRTLTTNELMTLENNTDLLNKPIELLNLLETESLQLKDEDK